ncbi:protein mono-ADP-ribosyltransferase PARP3 isoform X4 [Notamacropus eugenii]|uniref:protein mono-ADP-ribosyltransferase PARP3 isoform X4 n=1 Tax=Notamacropus eugenii TaxID=9315 RepID=UPI003B673687
MAPKRKAASASTGTPKKKEKPEAEDNFRLTIDALKAAPRETRKARVDSVCPLSSSPTVQVYEDYDCTLNQTNIGNNNNKFYLIQLLDDGGRYGCWNRWGRVGETGQSKLSFFPSLEEAKRDFEKKFWDKTKNRWADRDSFVAHSDVKKMPLGKLSKQQIAKGFEALEALEAALRKSSEAEQLEELSSQFYTIIPHNFGRTRPPPINSLEVLQAKKDMLLVLADIELAQALKAGQEEKEKKMKVEEVPHPLDRDYELLKCQLQPLATDAHEYKLIETYLKKTGWPRLRILHVWKINREGEGERFQDHAKLENRRLLWHGTNVAVVAAILKNGLRIMPHSGGRVGQGIYFASENSKSACYVRCTSQGIGLMFLSEVALGQEHHITKDDCSLQRPPPGYHSIVARGHTEPDPHQDVVLQLEGHKVMVPQGPPVPMPDFQESAFSQSEYLIYQESQCRLRYLLQLHF